MDFEGLETQRAETIQQTFKALMTIVEDKKTDVKDRIEAAKVIDSMSDSLIKAFLMSDHLKNTESTTKGLVKNLDKLMDEDEKK